MGQTFHDAVKADPSKVLCDFEFEGVHYISTHLYENNKGSNDEGW